MPQGKSAVKHPHEPSELEQTLRTMAKKLFDAGVASDVPDHDAINRIIAEASEALGADTASQDVLELAVKSAQLAGSMEKSQPEGGSVGSGVIDGPGVS